MQTKTDEDTETENATTRHTQSHTDTHITHIHTHTHTHAHTYTDTHTHAAHSAHAQDFVHCLFRLKEKEGGVLGPLDALGHKELCLQVTGV